jgi:hypothetical protein
LRFTIEAAVGGTFSPAHRTVGCNPDERDPQLYAKVDLAISVDMAEDAIPDRQAAVFDSAGPASVSRRLTRSTGRRKIVLSSLRLSRYYLRDAD